MTRDDIISALHESDYCPHEPEECDGECDSNNCVENALTEYENEIRADERRKVLEEVREVTKTIEASDILKMAKSCDKNCCECDGCLTTLLFEEMQEEK